MAGGTERKKQLLAVLAGLIVMVLGAGFANADVRGALAEAIVAADESAPAPVESEGDPSSDESPVVGALEADHAQPGEDEAKLEEEPEEVNEEPDDQDPGEDPDDQSTVGAIPPSAPAPDDDTDTDDGKTSIPLPGGDDDTDEGDDTDDLEDDAEETHDGDESADDD